MDCVKLRESIKESGLKIKFIEKSAELPATMLNQYFYGVKKLSPAQLARLKKTLKKHKINFAV